MNTAVTFVATVTDRDRDPQGQFLTQSRTVTVLAGPRDSDDDVSLLALQLVAARVPDGMVLGLDFVDSVA